MLSKDEHRSKKVLLMNSRPILITSGKLMNSFQRNGLSCLVEPEIQE